MIISNQLTLQICLLKISAFLAFQLPTLHYRKQDDGFVLTFPEMEGIKGILSIAQLNAQCPSYINYVTEAKGTDWLLEFKPLYMQDADIVDLSLVVEHENGMYYKNETRILQGNQLNPYSLYESQLLPTDVCENNIKYILDQDCKQSPTITRGKSISCADTLIFEEDFNSLNYSIWTHDIRSRVHVATEELVAFDKQTQNCFVKNGILHIVPTVNNNVREGVFNLTESCTGLNDPRECLFKAEGYTIKPPVISAQIHSRTSFSFKYGRVEIRAKLPVGDWIFPHLLLQPKSSHSENFYAKQVRMAFARGNTNLLNKNDKDIGGSHLYGGLLTWPSGDQGYELYKDATGIAHFGNDFHLYAFEWNADSMSFSVDNEVYGVIKNNLDQFNEEMFLVLGVTVGGFWNFKDNELKPSVKPYRNKDPKAALQFWRSKESWLNTWNGKEDMQIDYIRVYSV